MKPIRVLLAEDHTIVRAGLRALLDQEEGFVIVAEARDGREAVTLAKELSPDVVVMDITMPNLNGIEAARQLKEDRPDIPIVMLTVHLDEEYIFKSLDTGAEGYLVKSSAPDDLATAVKAAVEGETYLSPTIPDAVIQRYFNRPEDSGQLDSFQTLTRREREVLQLIAEGLSTSDIADQLFLSEKTIRTHRTNLMNKLGRRNVAALTRYALRKGLISLD